MGPATATLWSGTLVGVLSIGASDWGRATETQGIGVDSVRALETAREAQAAFERSRRYQLPRSWGGGGRCDERIGRFCYWYDEGDTALPKEPESVQRDRARLLHHLTLIHRELPGDDWLAGQRVRYFVEHGWSDSATAVAGACAGTDWWCQALRGYALHAGQRFAQADSAYRVALARMPEEERCRWTDWRDVLDADLLEGYRELSCQDRLLTADSLFWLASPLWSRPGNDLRTELLSRRVIAGLLAVSRSPQALPWGRDVSELTLRYGWPVAWTVAERSPGAVEPTSVVGHDRAPAFTFFPRRTGDSGGAAWRWELQRERPRSRYAPNYAGAIVPLRAYQLARFPRGDSTVVVGALDLAGDTLFSRGIDVALAVMPAWLGDPLVTRTDSTGSPSRVLVSVPGQPVGASLEVRATGLNRYARVRELFDPLDRAGGLVLSDLLLFSVGDHLPGTLADAMARALATTRIPRREPVGVYWEAEGIQADSLAVTVAVLPLRRGLLGRIGQSLALVRRRAPLTLGWSSPAPTERVVSRAFELDLARLARGSYVLRLTVSTPAGLERAVERRLELTN